MSSESSYGHRMAHTYGPICKLDRAQRLGWLRQAISEIEAAIDAERRAHRANCPECQTHEPCLRAFSIGGEAEMRRYNHLLHLRGMVRSEEQDAQYAYKARANGVDYARHIDGFCSYWQNVRYRKFASADWACEGCGKLTRLECHHLHYRTLGFEEVGDLRALCPSCHRREHGIGS